MKDVCWTLFSTSPGWVGLLVTPRGVRRLTLPQSSPDKALDILLAGEGFIGEECEDKARDVIERLVAFYRGEAVDFSDVELDMEGRPPFFRRVWQTVREIPRGETMTYGEVALRVGKPGAARAVGQAMAANPYPPIVPCHRVLGHKGRLGGFRGGLDLKRHLLALEGIQVPTQN